MRACGSDQVHIASIEVGYSFHVRHIAIQFSVFTGSGAGGFIFAIRCCISLCKQHLLSCLSFHFVDKHMHSLVSRPHSILFVA